MNLKGKKLLVLTGCNGAIDIITYAKNKGVTTIATDYYEKSIVKDLADYKYNVSTVDIAGVKEIAISHKVDGITTGTSEASMFTILNITKELGLPFYSTKEQLELINDKKKFKDLLLANQVKVTPEVLTTNNIDSVDYDKIEYPVVVKPVDSAGRKGITFCNSFHEIKQALNYALSESRIRTAIIEKSLFGMEEVFFLYTIIDGRFSLSAAFDKYLYYESGKKIGLPILNMFPSKRINMFMKSTHHDIISAFKSIGIKNGVISVQCFTDEENFYVYEAGYRLGGEQMYFFTNEVNKINSLEMMVNFSLTGKMSENSSILDSDNPYFDRPCYQLNVPLTPGKIYRLNGVDKIKKMDGVLNITQLKYLGDIIKNDGTLGRLALRIHIVADDENQMKNKINKINDTLDIRDEFGNDMILEKKYL